MGKLDGKVAIITGSTSGMGRATAYLFAEEGAKVVVTGRNEARAKEVVDNIKAKGGEATYVIADTQDLNDVDKIFDGAMAAYGTVDILYNNAGRQLEVPFMDVKLEDWTKTFNVNVTAAFLLAQKVAPIMKAKGHGIIINTASIAGTAAHWGYVGYVTSKHAMIGLTKCMAMELGPEIRVNGIIPGAIRTAMLEASGGEPACGFLIERSPLKRIGDGEEIARTALFLATEESSFICGQLIRVDGGVDI